MFRISTLALFALGVITSMSASAFNAEDHLAWIKANQEAQPQFVEGDIITYDKADLIRPFIPKEQQDDLIFPGMEMTIKDAGDLSPAEAFQTATKKILRYRYYRRQWCDW